jgi:hypothetical protein
MQTTRGEILDLLLQDLSRSLPVAPFLRALGEPPELESSASPRDFWQDDLRVWIRADYGARLERVLQAYTAMRPEDLAPATGP